MISIDENRRENKDRSSKPSSIPPIATKYIIIFQLTLSSLSQSNLTDVNHLPDNDILQHYTP